MPRPNILFMLSDDHAVQAISACGSRVNETPNIDRLAKEGAVFDQSFCCNSICAPSRAAILTGNHSYQNGVLVLQDPLPANAVTFAGQLRDAGYTTAIAGKWHLHRDPSDFDFWQVLPGQGSYYNPTYLTPDGEIQLEGYSEDITTDTMLEWLKNGRDKEKPFLACCHFKAPHRPWMPPERHYHLYDDRKFPEPPNLRDNYADRCRLLKENQMEIARHMNWRVDLKIPDPGSNADRLPMGGNPKSSDSGEVLRMTDEQRAKWQAANGPREEFVRNHTFSDEEFVEWTYQTYLTDYLRCIAAIDDNVGRLLDYLDASGLAENTIVIYCSDQGFYLGEHGWFDKRWMFEESMRMPLLMRWPGRIVPGTRYGQMVQNIDYAPTLLEACGVQSRVEMHGSSLLPVIDEGAVPHDDLYYHYYADGGHGVPKHDGVRTQRFKLVHFYSVGEFNLFDLEKDPHEMRSVHNDPAYTDVLNQMKQRYAAARERYEIPAEWGG